MVSIPRAFSDYPMSGGVPYTQMPTAITGYYRYSLPGNDSAIIHVVFKKMGAVVANNIFKIRGTGSLASFTAFNFPLSLSVIPDSVTIVASASNLYGPGLEAGSWLELDNMAFTVAGSAQPIYGGSFDSWPSKIYEHPQGWRTLLFGSTPAVTKSTVHYSGNYSVQLTTQPYVPLSWGGYDAAPAQMTIGRFYMLFGYSGGGEQAGVLCPDTTGILAGYYQYMPSGTDSAECYLYMTTGMGTGGVGGGSRKLGPTSTWKYFEAPFHGVVAPNSLNIIFTSGRDYSVTPGSVLRLDSMFITHTSQLGLANNNAQGANELLIYPNPSAGICHIRATRPLRGIVTVYDNRGASVFTGDLSGTNADVDLGNQPVGLYFVRVCDVYGGVLKTMTFVRSEQ